MQDNWAPGDIALCIKTGPWSTLIDTIFGQALVVTNGPQAGEINRVVEVDAHEHGCKCGSTALLVFERWGDNRWCACAFVKVTPGEEVRGREVEKRRPLPVEDPHAPYPVTVSEWETVDRYHDAHVVDWLVEQWNAKWGEVLRG